MTAQFTTTTSFWAVKASRSLVAACLVVLSLVAASCDSASGKFGAELYEHSCASCHNGIIGPEVGAGSDSESLSDQQIADVIRVGPGTMPSFARVLSDTQIESLVEYIRALQAQG